MPGQDGTGPKGEGPITGCGRGFCILKVDSQEPEMANGFAGLAGKPVTVSISNSKNKEVSTMPRGDGTGPAGAGLKTGRGMGQGQGQGRARMGGFGLGSGGQCVCPTCGKKVSHQRGAPCNQIKCPSCGATMTREP